MIPVRFAAAIGIFAGVGFLIGMVAGLGVTIDVPLIISLVIAFGGGVATLFSHEPVKKAVAIRIRS